MESNFKIAASCSVRYIISAIATFFIYLSLVVIMTGAFTSQVGYTAYNADTNEVLYHYYYEDGDDLKKADYEQQGINVSTVALRSTLQGKPKFFAVFTGQTVGLMLTLSFIHNVLWKVGDSDANLETFNHRDRDLLRGLKIGLCAGIPNVAAFLIAILARLNVLPGGVACIYRFINYQFFALGNVFFGYSLINYSDISWGLLLSSAVLMLLLPLICTIMYLLGHKHIIILDKLIYKNKKDMKK